MNCVTRHAHKRWAYNLPGNPGMAGTGGRFGAGGGMTTWSRANAKTALAAGSITQAQFVSVMGFIATWEQEQKSAALSVLRASGDLAPA
jgi:hypothetical protein